MTTDTHQNLLSTDTQARIEALHELEDTNAALQASETLREALIDILTGMPQKSSDIFIALLKHADNAGAIIALLQDPEVSSSLQLPPEMSPRFTMVAALVSKITSDHSAIPTDFLPKEPTYIRTKCHLLWSAFCRFAAVADISPTTTATGQNVTRIHQPRVADERIADMCQIIVQLCEYGVRPLDLG